MSVTNNKIISFLLLTLFLLCSCSSDKKTDTLFSQADSLLTERPDSALALLKMSPKELQELSDKERARYTLLLAKATDKAEQSLLPCDSLLNLALHYYHKANKERAIALLYKARLEIEMNSTEEAIGHLQEGLAILKNFPNEVETRRNTLSSLGNLYYNARYYNESIKIYRQLYECCTTDKDKSIALYNISSSYAITDQIDSTLSTGRKALNYAISSGDSSITANINLSLSLDFYDSDNLDSALYYAREALKNAPQKEPKGRYYYNLGNILLEARENKDTVSSYINKAIEDQSFNGKCLCLRSLSDLNKELGNYKASTNYLERYIDIIDSTFTEEQATKVQQLIYGYKTKMKVREERLKEQRTLWIIIASFGLICFLIILIYQNYINRKKTQQLHYQQALEQTRSKLSSLQATIHDNQSIIHFLQQQCSNLEEEKQKNKQQIQEREQSVTQLEEEKLQLYNGLFSQSDICKKITALSNQDLADKKNLKVLTISEQDKLRKTIYDIYTDYINELQKNYPRLTEDDILLLCLQKTSLDSRVIALCFGYSDTHAINQRKSRIKERMRDTEIEM
ncbi:MAG: hypothetical protein LKI39_06990 [Bacteroides sp.]|jgi:uncharacterized protein (DUF1697 family)|nr:hypothetical protein [Bacteroides sp.]MCI1682290.1 hypothetical protein [Bacteroides sp.]